MAETILYYEAFSTTADFLLVFLPFNFFSWPDCFLNLGAFFFLSVPDLFTVSAGIGACVISMGVDDYSEGLSEFVLAAFCTG